MEQRFGTRLFDRTTNGYRLTDAGSAVFKRLTEVEEEITGIERRLISQDKNHRGVLRISCTESMANLYLAEKIAEFVRLHPDIEISLSCTLDMANLSRHEADVAIRTTLEPTGTLIGRKLAKAAFAVYYSPENMIYPFNIQDTEEWPWIGWQDGEYNRMMILNEFPGANITHRVDDIQTMRNMTRFGLGVAVLPCYMADAEPELVRLVAKPMIDNTPDLWLLFHPDVKNIARVKLFTKYIYDHIRADRDLFEGTLT